MPLALACVSPMLNATSMLDVGMIGALRPERAFAVAGRPKRRLSVTFTFAAT